MRPLQSKMLSSSTLLEGQEAARKGLWRAPTADKSAMQKELEELQDCKGCIQSACRLRCALTCDCIAPKALQALRERLLADGQQQARQVATPARSFVQPPLVHGHADAQHDPYADTFVEEPAGVEECTHDHADVDAYGDTSVMESEDDSEVLRFLQQNAPRSRWANCFVRYVQCILHVS